MLQNGAQPAGRDVMVGLIVERSGDPDPVDRSLDRRFHAVRRQARLKPHRDLQSGAEAPFAIEAQGLERNRGR